MTQGNDNTQGLQPLRSTAIATVNRWRCVILSAAVETCLLTHKCKGIALSVHTRCSNMTPWNMNLSQSDRVEKGFKSNYLLSIFSTLIHCININSPVHSPPLCDFPIQILSWSKFILSRRWEALVTFSKGVHELLPVLVQSHTVHLRGSKMEKTFQTTVFYKTRFLASGNCICPLE